MEKLEITGIDGSARKHNEGGIGVFNRVSERVLKILDAYPEMLGSEEDAKNIMIILKNQKMKEWNGRSLEADESGNPLPSEKLEEIWARELAEEVKSELEKNNGKK